MTLVQPLIGLLSLSLYVLTVVGASALILPLGLLKWLVPGLRGPCNRWLDRLASGWIEVNAWHQRWLARTDIRVTGDLDRLSREHWYLLVANHQSWVDILVLVRVLNRRIPYVKFFFKRELLWVPVLGQALWAMDFPVMRRRKRRDPGAANEDMERTRRACDLYRHSPVTIVNFIEGTRFTPAKQRAQAEAGGPVFHRLLKPKAGGVAFTLSAMDGRLRHLLDATIFYPDGPPRFWDYACGRVRRVWLDLRVRPIGPERVGDYPGDPAFRAEFQAWVNELWRDKDRRLAAMAEEARH